MLCNVADVFGDDEFAVKIEGNDGCLMNFGRIKKFNEIGLDIILPDIKE